jgi:hypothetical protein
MAMTGFGHAAVVIPSPNLWKLRLLGRKAGALVIVSSVAVEERRLQRLEDRYRRAQLAAAAASTRYSTLRETAGTTKTQLLYAQRCVEEEHRYLIDLQTAIEYTEDHAVSFD